VITKIEYDQVFCVIFKLPDYLYKYHAIYSKMIYLPDLAV